MAMNCSSCTDNGRSCQTMPTITPNFAYSLIPTCSKPNITKYASSFTDSKNITQKYLQIKTLFFPSQNNKHSLATSPAWVPKPPEIYTVFIHGHTCYNKCIHSPNTCFEQNCWNCFHVQDEQLSLQMWMKNRNFNSILSYNYYQNIEMAECMAWKEQHKMESSQDRQQWHSTMQLYIYMQTAIQMKFLKANMVTSMWQLQTQIEWFISNLGTE